MRTPAGLSLRDQILAYLRAQVGPRTTTQVIAAFPKRESYLVIACLHSLAVANLASWMDIWRDRVWRAPAVPDAELADLEAHFLTEAL
jgi:hypothetical protein